jgi:shikimate kinase
MGKGQTLDDLYKLRMPLYEKYADITVMTDNKRNMEDTVADILKQI